MTSLHQPDASTDAATVSAASATFEQLRQAVGENAPTDEQLTAHFAPVFAAIAAGSDQREQDHTLAFDAIELLRQSGFTRVRLSHERGGIGASLPQLALLLVDLAAADSNLPQALHGHYMFTEQHEAESQGEVSDWWIGQVAEGKIFGNALVELPPSAGKRPVIWTPVDPAAAPAAEGPTPLAHITGDKFYSTGALFADYLLVTATQPGQNGDDDAVYFTIVDATDPGVRRIDDWSGFGQRLTASGTTTFDDVPVCPHRLQEFDTPTGVLAYTVLWIVLAATQTGIGQNALHQITQFVRERRRTYNHATAETPAQDPLVHEVIGAVSAKVSVARFAVAGAAAVAEKSFRAVGGHTDLEDPVVIQAHTEANIALSETTAVVSELILQATNQIFESGGASAVDTGKNLHRHWLNARTIASHTPLIYRVQAVGNYRINGITPPFHSTARNSDPNAAAAAAQTTQGA